MCNPLRIFVLQNQQLIANQFQLMVIPPNGGFGDNPVCSPGNPQNHLQ